MATKGINYLSRTFDTIKEELVKFSRDYYPDVADDFNDSSIGAWVIDLLSAVGDDLFYYMDRISQDGNINSTSSMSAVMNLARANGLKVPGPKASTCEVELSCVLPLGGSQSNIAQPDWNYAPIVERGSSVGAGSYVFELTENVNFAEQFNSNGFSNRTIVPSRDANGNITGYTVTKTVLAVNGSTRVYKKVIYSSDLEPFMEVVLPDNNVMNVESVIFKDTSNYSITPQTQEYYIDEEEYHVPNEAVKTYRFFECDALVDQYRFGVQTNIDERVMDDMYNSELYDDYTERAVISVETNESGEAQYQTATQTTRYYRGKWKALRQKYITEFTDKGFMKIIFGSGNSYGDVPSGYTTFAEYEASKLINNDMLGVLPKEGWTMFVLYRVGGGIFSNLGPNSINEIVQSRVSWARNPEESDAGIKKGRVLSSLRVRNTSTAVAGKDSPTVNEIKNLIKYNSGAQNRAVTVTDYKVKLMQMPPKFGAPFRCSVVESNNKVEMDFLGLNAAGKLDSSLPQTLVENMIEWMSHYKQINDYIEMRSGRIYNIGIAIDVFVDKNYNMANVIKNIIDRVYAYFNVNEHDMGEDIFMGDLQKEINLLDGVLSLIDLRVYALNGGIYSPDICPLPRYVENQTCDTSTRWTFTVGNDVVAEELDMNELDGVLTSDYNSMFEILDATNDIQVRAKLR